MNRPKSPADPLAALADEILPLRPRSLGELALAQSAKLNELRTSSPHSGRPPVTVSGRFRNLVVVTGDDPGPGPSRLVYPPVSSVTTPLLDAVMVLDDDGYQQTEPMTIAGENAADVYPDGSTDPVEESTLTITTGERVMLPTIAHQLPLTKSKLAKNPTLKALIDRYMSNGLLVKLQHRIAATLAGADLAVHEFEGTLAATVRLGVAAAQDAFPELGADEIVVVLSPSDHAELDLAGFNLREWPARVISVPGIPSGVGYAGPLGLAVHVVTGAVVLQLGFVADQFTKNEITALATIEAFPYVAAPSALVRLQLSEEELS